MFVIEETGFIRWLYNKIKKRHPLEFTTKLTGPETGLPVNVYLDDAQDYIYNCHPKRVIFQGDYEHDVNWENLFFMTISKDDPQVNAKQLRKLKLPAKDIEAIKTFVKNNAELLDELADEKVDWTPFFERLKKYS